MEQNAEINKKIIDGIRNKDDELLDISLYELENYLKGKKFYKSVDYIDKINLNDKEKIMLYIKTSIRKDDLLSLSFRREIFSEAFDKYIRENQEKFYNILKKDQELQEEYAKWFIEFKPLTNYLYEDLYDLYSKLFELNIFKEIVLSDEDFISTQYYNDEFFMIIPNDYAYLISYFDTKSNLNSEKIFELYNDKFKDKLSEKEQLELIKTQVSIYEEPNIFEIKRKDRMQEFTYGLKKITKDPKYFQTLKDIMKKTNLDLKNVIKLVYKYDNTKLIKDIITNDSNITPDTIEKINYLAIENKINDITSINDLEKISMEELKKLKKENKNNLEISISGGPQSRTNNLFFKNDYGHAREIISISKEGRFKLEPINIFSDHNEGVKNIYKEIEFPEECQTAVERSIYVARNILSTTLIIEKEVCFFVMPDTLTKEQIKTINSLLDKARDNVDIGLIICNIENNTEEIAFNGDCISKEKTKEYIEEFNKKSHTL